MATPRSSVHPHVEGGPRVAGQTPTPRPRSVFWGLGLQRIRGMRAGKAQPVGMEMGDRGKDPAGRAGRSRWGAPYLLATSLRVKPQLLPPRNDENGTQKIEVSSQHLP